MGTAVTDSSGVATRDYTPSEVGTFAILAEFGRDHKQAAVTSKEVTLTVNEGPASLIVRLSNTFVILVILITTFSIMVVAPIWRKTKSDMRTHTVPSNIMRAYARKFERSEIYV